MLEELSASQLDDWLCWLRKFMPFPNRNDPYFAMLLASWSDKARPQDFMFYDTKDAADEDITSEELACRISNLIPKA